MQVLVNTDNNIEGSEALTRQVKTLIDTHLARFRGWITRVEVQFSDESSSAKPRENDQRCVMEARPGGLPPITVSHQGPTLDAVLNACVRKLERLLSDTAERLGDPRGRPSYSGDRPGGSGG